MPLLHLTTGKENHRDRSAQVQAFLHVDGKECPVFVAPRKTDKAEFKDKVTQVGTPTHHQARAGVKADVGGSWVVCNYEIANNTLLKLSIAKSVPSNRRNVMRFIYMREDAAYNRIVIPLRIGNRSQVDEAIIEGNFDVLTLEQALERGAVINPNFERMFSEVMFNSMCRVEQKEPARTALPAVVTVEVEDESGNKRRVARAGRRRSLNI